MIHNNENRHLEKEKTTRPHRINSFFLIQLHKLHSHLLLIPFIFFLEFLDFWLNSLHFSLRYHHFMLRKKKKNTNNNGYSNDCHSERIIKNISKKSKKIKYWSIEKSGKNFSNGSSIRNLKL